MYAGLVDQPKATFSSTTGCCVSAVRRWQIVHDGVAAENYTDFIGEATVANSYLKAPYYARGWSRRELYRVGPLARINAAEALGTPRPTSSYGSSASASGAWPHAFLYHYARLIEILYAWNACRSSAGHAR